MIGQVDTDIAQVVTVECIRELDAPRDPRNAGLTWILWFKDRSASKRFLGRGPIALEVWEQDKLLRGPLNR